MLLSNFCKNRFFSKRNIIIGTILLVFLLALVFYKSSKKTEPPPNKLVEVSSVKLETIQQKIRLLGTIHPKHATILIAKGAGVLDILVPSGQTIKKGSLLAKIDNIDIEKNVQLSVNAEELAKNQYERFLPLIKKGYVSPKESEEKKQVWIEAQKELSRAKIEIDNLRFYAPFDGIVGAYRKREGAQVSQGESIVSMYDPASLVVDFDIPCSNLNQITAGQAVYLLGKSYPLTHVQKMLDEETHMCPADFDIHCADCLIGSTVTVDLVVLEKQKALVIPFQSVFLRNSQPAVYVVDKGVIKLTPVKTGIQQEERIEITEGLKVGQQIVIKGQERLYPEMTVDIYQPQKQTKTQ
jgi:membrane fusion protein (multidrug efflux system)